MSSSETVLREDPLVSFIVPCLNEEANVIGAIEKLVQACRQAGHSFEIIVADDGSRDGTSAVVKAFQTRHPDLPIKLIRNDATQGVARTFFDVSFVAKCTYYRLVAGGVT